MGQPIYGHLTPDGYPDRSSEWLSNNDLLARFNFAVAFATNKINGTKIDTRKLFGDTQKTDARLVVDAMAKLILMNQISTHTRNSLDKAAADGAKPPAMPSPVTLITNAGVVKPNAPNLAALAAASNKDTDNKVAELLALTLGAPEFQRK